MYITTLTSQLHTVAAQGVLVRNQTKRPMNAIAQIEPPMIKNLEDELFFFPLRERRVGDV